MRRIGGMSLLAVVGLSLTACVGPSQGTKKTLNTMLAAQNFDGAAAHLEKVKEKQYGKKNAVLFHLDEGMVLHHARKYKESEEHLAKAEERMEELFTKSISKGAATLAVNDATVDYAGEPYERSFMNAIRALNYVCLGKPEEALVEARKVEVYLDELNRRREEKRAFRDDAFTRYLDSLLYEDAGKHDDARISREAAMKAYTWYASAYNVAAPTFAPVKEPGRNGEVVFIHYNGVAPRKASKTLQIAWNDAVGVAQSSTADTDDKASAQKVENAVRAGVLGKSIVIALPEYVQDPFMIADSEVEAGGKSGGTQLVQDLAAIAVNELKDRMPLIRTRAIIRATVKFILAKAATDQAAKKGQAAKWITQISANVAAAASEVADTRAWSTMPAQVRMARLMVPPGTHNVTARFKDARGAVVATHVFENVEVKKGKRTYLHYRTAQ